MLRVDTLPSEEQVKVLDRGLFAVRGISVVFKDQTMLQDFTPHLTRWVDMYGQGTLTRYFHASRPCMTVSPMLKNGSPPRTPGQDTHPLA